MTLSWVTAAAELVGVARWHLLCGDSEAKTTVLVQYLFESHNVVKLLDMIDSLNQTALYMGI